MDAWLTRPAEVKRPTSTALTPISGSGTLRRREARAGRLTGHTGNRQERGRLARRPPRPLGRVVRQDGDSLGRDQRPESAPDCRGIQPRSVASPSYPDGRRGVSSGEDATIRVWDLETGVELHRFEGRHGFGWLAVSPDGRRLLSASFWGRELGLWDLEAKKPITQINFGGVPPIRGCFTPDGLHAVWGGNDGIVRMYRLNGLEPVNRPVDAGGRFRQAVTRPARRKTSP